MRALYCAPNKCNFDPEIDKINPPCSEKVKFIELQAKFGTVFFDNCFRSKPQLDMKPQS